jgi:hypothetical protein
VAADTKIVRCSVFLATVVPTNFFYPALHHPCRVGTKRRAARWIPHRSYREMIGTGCLRCQFLEMSNIGVVATRSAGSPCKDESWR